MACDSPHERPSIVAGLITQLGTEAAGGLLHLTGSITVPLVHAEYINMAMKTETEKLHPYPHKNLPEKQSNRLAICLTLDLGCLKPNSCLSTHRIGTVHIKTHRPGYLTEHNIGLQQFAPHLTHDAFISHRIGGLCISPRILSQLALSISPWIMCLTSDRVSHIGVCVLHQIGCARRIGHITSDYARHIGHGIPHRMGHLTSDWVSSL